VVGCWFWVGWVDGWVDGWLGPVFGHSTVGACKLLYTQSKPIPYTPHPHHVTAALARLKYYLWDSNLVADYFNIRWVTQCQATPYLE
jgi:hypothetical protein